MGILLGATRVRKHLKYKFWGNLALFMWSCGANTSKTWMLSLLKHLLCFHIPLGQVVRAEKVKMEKNGAKSKENQEITIFLDVTNKAPEPQT